MASSCLLGLTRSRRRNARTLNAGDSRRATMEIRNLENFAFSKSVRGNAGLAMRRRTEPVCDEEKMVLEENAGGEVNSEMSTSRSFPVKLRSTRVRRAVTTTEVRTRIVKSKCVDHLRDQALERSVGSASDVRGEYERLGARFYDCDALELAPKLLGKLLRRDDVILRITEVEAYRPGDSACHGRVGVTARTAPLFGPAGHAYVYLCYGIHMMLNIVADNVGIGSAVLIRACSPVAGLDRIQSRRGQTKNKPVLLTGPGKVGQALGLTTEWSTHPLYTAGGLEILDAPPPASILVGPRVGINYADPKDVAAPWRFAIAENDWISAPRGTLNPLQHTDHILPEVLGYQAEFKAKEQTHASTKKVTEGSDLVIHVSVALAVTIGHSNMFGRDIVYNATGQGQRWMKILDLMCTFCEHGVPLAFS